MLNNSEKAIFLPKSSNTLEMKKEKKKLRALKEARVIVRNLPFQATESNVTDLFSSYGNIVEVVLLRKENKLVGCGFVQFDSKTSAAKAIAKTSGKLFMGRPVIVDWAVSKSKYASLHGKKNIKAEADESMVKKEPIVCETAEEQASLLGESDSERDDSCVEANKKDTPGRNQLNKRSMREDVITEFEKTLFIKNIPFSATNEDLKKCVEKFGEVCYALICFDPLTEHSRGTAFVKFKDKGSVERCMNAGSAFELNGTILDPHLALPKDKLPKKEEKKVKDNRNLYLAKEGVIIAGTPSASGVSASDMSKRLCLEHWKSQKLRNLSMFVSKTRLVVHNLPQQCDNKKLFKIFKENGPPNTAPIKAKVMRHFKDVDENGVGRSKGFGFVDFENHADALASLRAVNNNPSIFSKSLRPIVSFAIENSSAIKAKEQRLIKMKSNNVKGNVSVKCNDSDLALEAANTTDLEREQFVGINASLGNKKMLTKATLKKQAMVHNQELKKEKVSRKRIKKKPRRMRKVEGERIFKKIEAEDDFSKLVEKHKTKICTNKKKWYD